MLRRSEVARVLPNLSEMNPSHGLLTKICVLVFDNWGFMATMRAYAEA